MAGLMAHGSDLLDSWVKHTKDNKATTPELVAMLLMQIEASPNKASVMAVLAATAIQRLVAEQIVEDPA
jgi:hypothetical protein